MKQRFRQPLALAGSAVLLFASVGCGSDDDGASGEASIDEFCAETEAAEASGSDDLMTQADVDAMRDLAARAPAEIRDAIETTADGFAEAIALGDDPEDMDRFFELMFTDEMIAAGIELEEFRVEQCGLPPADPNDDRIEMSELEESGALDTSGDPEGPATVEGLEAFLGEQNMVWFDKITSYEQTPDGWTVTGSDLGTDGIFICSAASNYLLFTAPGEVVTVIDDSDGGSTPVAASDGVGVCDDV